MLLNNMKMNYEYVVSSEGTNETQPAHVVDEITAFVTLVQFLISTGGIILYILTIWIMIKHRRNTFANPFYTLAIALAAPDCLHLVMEIVCAVPVAFIGFENVPLIFVAICGYLTDVAYWCLAPTMVVISVNRYIAVCYFQAYRSLFSTNRLKTLIISCWGLGLFLPSLMYGCTCLYLFKGEDVMISEYFACHKHYFHAGYAWKFYCSGGCAEQAVMTNMVMASSLTISVALIYAVTLVQYKLIQHRMERTVRDRRASANRGAGGDSNRQRKKEAALMFQFALISLVLILYIFSFWFVSLVWPNRYGDMFLNFFVSLNSCVSPILYLSFGSEFQARLPWRKRRVASGTGRPAKEASMSAVGATNAAWHTTARIIHVKPHEHLVCAESCEYPACSKGEALERRVSSRRRHKL